MAKVTKKLNIAIVCDSIDYIIGGSYESIRRFSTKLAERGHNITFISSKFENNKHRTKFTDKFEIYRFPSFKIGPDDYMLSLPSKKSIKNLFISKKIDILYAAFPQYSAIVAISVAHELGIPIASHLFMQPQSFIELNKALRIISKPVGEYLKFFHNKTDLVFCPNKFSKNVLKDCGINKSKKIVSNGVDIKIFKHVSKKLSDYVYNKYKLDKGKFNIILLSRLSPEKSIDTAVKAMRMLVKSNPELQMIIIGRGKLYKPLNRQIVRYKLQENIKILNNVPDEDKVALLNIGNLFIHPSILELEGMAILEAMACGLPILVSDAKDSASSSLVEGNGLVFKSRKPEKLALKIKYLLSRPALLKAMKNKSIALSKKYDIKKSVDIVECSFYELVKKAEKS